MDPTVVDCYALSPGRPALWKEPERSQFPASTWVKLEKDIWNTNVSTYNVKWYKITMHHVMKYDTV